jgi:hypothetical protein
MGCNCGPLCDPRVLVKDLIDDQSNTIVGGINVFYCKRCSTVFNLDGFQPD